MRRYLIGTAVAAAAAGMVWAAIQANPAYAQDDRKSLMQQKLREAQNVLRALAVEDFDAIADSALELNQISIEAEWTEALSPLYGQIGEEFRTATDRMRRAAKDENLDGATLYYNQMVTTCVECHRVVRAENNLAALDTPDRAWR